MKLTGILLAFGSAATAVALPQPGVMNKRSHGGLSDNLCKVVWKRNMDCEADITAVARMPLYHSGHQDAGQVRTGPNPPRYTGAQIEVDRAPHNDNEEDAILTFLISCTRSEIEFHLTSCAAHRVTCHAPKPSERSHSTALQGCSPSDRPLRPSDRHIMWYTHNQVMHSLQLCTCTS